MKPKNQGSKVSSVDLPPDGGGEVGRIAVASESKYSTGGLVVGALFMVGAIVLFFRGIMGSSHFVASLDGLKIDISDASAGVILATLGVLIIWGTRFKVTMGRNKKED